MLMGVGVEDKDKVEGGGYGWMDGVRVADVDGRLGHMACFLKWGGWEVQPKCMLVFSSVSGLAH